MPDFNFWNNRWINKEIGFHQSNVHKSLNNFGELFKDHKLIFVPLCGKSLDMIYLRELGHEIIGVEFSEHAILEFIQENNLVLNKTILSHFTLYHGQGFKIYQGNLFDLTSQDLLGVSAAYDRASMVAFDVSERKKYAQFLIQTASDVEFLLAPLLDYGVTYSGGPPFSVSEMELRELYGEHFDLKILNVDKLPARERFREMGITIETEITWQMNRKHKGL